MSLTEIIILTLAVIAALYLGWRRGAVHGSRNAMNLIVSALAIQLDDEFPKFISELANIFKTRHDEVHAGSKLVEGFLD